MIPNTVDMALQPSKESRAIMKSDPPLFPVLHINAAWTELSGIPQVCTERCYSLKSIAVLQFVM